MKFTRRIFLTAAACGAASLALDASAKAADTLKKKHIKLGISTYSYWHFRPPKVSIERVIDKSAEIGVEGVDILHRQMDIPERDPLNATGRPYLRKLKRHAFLNGIDLICVSTHQTFVSPKADEIDRNVEHTNKCLEIAYELGAPCIRINTVRWCRRLETLFFELRKDKVVDGILCPARIFYFGHRRLCRRPKCPVIGRAWRFSRGHQETCDREQRNKPDSPRHARRTGHRS